MIFSMFFHSADVLLRICKMRKTGLLFPKFCFFHCCFAEKGLYLKSDFFASNIKA